MDTAEFKELKTLSCRDRQGQFNSFFLFLLLYLSTEDFLKSGQANPAKFPRQGTKTKES